MRKGPGTPAGTEIGVACTAWRFPCAGTLRTKSRGLDPQRRHVAGADGGAAASGRKAAEGDQRAERGGGEAQAASRLRAWFVFVRVRLTGPLRRRPRGRGARPGRRPEAAA